MNQGKRSAECFKRGYSSPTYRSWGILAPFAPLGKKFQNLILRQIVFFFAAFIKHDFAVV